MSQKVQNWLKINKIGTRTSKYEKELGRPTYLKVGTRNMQNEYIGTLGIQAK